MSSFTNFPSIRQLPDGIRWITLEDFEYHVGSEDSSDIVRVPKGFVTDGASIPRFFWRMIGHPFGEYAYASFLHDYMCINGKKSRADFVFYEAMGVLKVSEWKRSMMYFAIRMFHLFQK